MKYTTKVAERSTVKITIKFDGEEWKAAVNAAYMKTRSRFAVNGFRKGKAPKHVIENVYGKGVFYEDALNMLFSENYGKILEKESKKYTFVGEPDVSIDKFEEDLISLIAIVPVKPEPKISAYTGMKIQKYEYTVTDADVDAEFAKYAEMYKMDVETLKKFINPEELKKDLAISKAVDFIIENAKVGKPAAKKTTKKAAADGEEKAAAKKPAAKKTTTKKAAADGEAKPAAKKTTKKKEEAAE